MRVGTLCSALLLTTALWVPAQAQELPAHTVPIGKGPGFIGFGYAGPCPVGQVLGWYATNTDPGCVTGGGGGGGVSSITVGANTLAAAITFIAGANMAMNVSGQNITFSSTGGGGDPCLALNLTGDVHSTNSCLATLSTVNSSIGSFGTANQVATFTVNAKGLITAASNTPISLPFTSMTGTLGCAQMPTLTGDVTAAGGTCGTAIATGAVTNVKLAAIPATSLKGNPTSSAAAAQDFTIQGLVNKPSPDVANDRLLLYDASTNSFKNCTVSQCSTSGTAGVSSLNALVGALTLSGTGGITITPSGSNIQVGFTAPTMPTITTFTSGSGTYNRPAGVVRIEVQMVGGGGGGQGGGTTPGPGVGGLNTTFGIYTANGGGSGGTGGGVGGTATGCHINAQGGAGDSGSLAYNTPVAFSGKAGAGGNSFFAGGPRGAYNLAGNSVASGLGSGGSGGAAGSSAIALGGGGGGAGGYCFVQLNNPTATYSYSVGTGGTAGAAGTGSGDTAGGLGSPGFIIIHEFYSVGGGGGGAGGGVSSLNTLLGDLTIAAGSGISIAQAGSTITVTNSSAAGAIFTTGDIKPTMKTVADAGWIMMNDGTIGNAASGGTARANADTQALYVLLWTNCLAGVSGCQVAPGGRGATALADFNANKTIQLPQSMSRTVGVAGAGQGLSTRALGQALGTETSLGVPGTASVTGSHTLTIGEIPSHNHTITNSGDPPWKFLSADTTGTSGVLNSDVFTGTTYGASNAFTPTGAFVGGGGAFTMTSTGSTATDIQMFEPKVYWNWMIKL